MCGLLTTRQVALSLKAPYCSLPPPPSEVLIHLVIFASQVCSSNLSSNHVFDESEPCHSLSLRGIALCSRSPSGSSRGRKAAMYLILLPPFPEVHFLTASVARADSTLKHRPTVCRLSNISCARVYPTRSSASVRRSTSRTTSAACKANARHH